MIEVSDGKKSFLMTEGAFESVYKKLVFKLVTNDEDAKLDLEEDEDMLFAEELEKKPISEWTNEEVRRYASVYGIDISETKSPSEAKELIKKFNDEVDGI